MRVLSAGLLIIVAVTGCGTAAAQSSSPGTQTLSSLGKKSQGLLLPQGQGFRTSGRDMLAELMATSDRAPVCAQIEIIEAPDADAKMIIETPKNFGGTIQTYPALPACGNPVPLLRSTTQVAPKPAPSEPKPIQKIRQRQPQ